MNRLFSDRISDVPRSFIREILKVALEPGVISFAGGLPNRDLFPLDAIANATQQVFTKYGTDVLQYANSEGFGPLREAIAQRYREKQGLDISPDSILITSGSQQGLDLLGKIFINDGEDLIIEEPGYLGAIQAFSIYKPKYHPIPVSDCGMDVDLLKATLQRAKPKLMYTVPNFQNPSGISYNKQNREDIAEILSSTRTLLIEDDPYGDLRFSGERIKSFKHMIPVNTVLLGSFSKSVVPGFRLGWIVAPDEIMKKLLIAKQATDLHTSHFTQCIVYEFLQRENLDDHIEKIKAVYGKQCQAMIRAIGEHFPKDVYHTTPNGGMFLWAELPHGLSAMELFELAVKDKVVFVPGNPFYVGTIRPGTMRLNFSCVDEKTITNGIGRLGEAIERLMDK